MEPKALFFFFFFSECVQVNIPFVILYAQQRDTISSKRRASLVKPINLLADEIDGWAFWSAGYPCRPLQFDININCIDPGYALGVGGEWWRVDTGHFIIEYCHHASIGERKWGRRTAIHQERFIGSGASSSSGGGGVTDGSFRINWQPLCGSNTCCCWIVDTTCQGPSRGHCKWIPFRWR